MVWANQQISTVGQNVDVSFMILPYRSCYEKDVRPSETSENRDLCFDLCSVIYYRQRLINLTHQALPSADMNVQIQSEISLHKLVRPDF